MQGTYSAKAEDITRSWFIVDAAGKPLGRLASEIARVLRGKHRPTFTPHVDTGDYVIVTNVGKVTFSGKKWDQKQYAWVTGYPGQKIEKAGARLQRRPELILREAVRRMLPKNKLAFKMLNKLKLYPGTEHLMGWEVGEYGFRIVLDPDLTDFVEQVLAADIKSFLADYGLIPEQVATWICHPGGPKVIAKIVETLGTCQHGAVVARSGAEALAISRQQRFDVIILAAHVGSEDGLRLVTQLRAQEDTRQVPIV